MITIEQMIDREVHCCLSSLVSTLANSCHDTVSLLDTRGLRSVQKKQKALGELLEQAFELASPIPDYEEAATQAGYESDGRGFWFNPETGEGKDQDLRAEDLDIEPYHREVYEHWSVSNWLAEKLIAQGEKVDTDFAAMNVWVRTTTGQQISADSVIEWIYATMTA